MYGLLGTVGNRRFPRGSVFGSRGVGDLAACFLFTFQRVRFI